MKYLTCYLANGYSFPFAMDGPDWRSEAVWHARLVARDEGTSVTAVYYFDPAADMMTRMFEWTGRGDSTKFLAFKSLMPARRLRLGGGFN